MSNILNNILKRQNPVQNEIPPYTLHLTDKVVNLDNGRMLMVFELDGLLFESHENYRLQSFNDALTRLFTDIATQYPDQIQFHTNIIRSKVLFEADYRFDNFFVQNFHEKYISRFNDKDYFKNSFYLTVVFKYDHMTQALIDMKEIETTLVHSLADYRIHVLSTYRRVNGLRANDVVLEVDDEPELREKKEKYIEFINSNGVLYSEVYEYLGRLINTYEKPQPLTGSFAYQILPEVNYFFGYDVVEIRGDRYKKYATCFDLKDFPLESKMGMFNMPLLDQQVEFIFTMCFTGINKHKAEGLVKDKLNQFRSVNDRADYQLQEMENLLAYLKNSEIALGIFSSSLVVYGDTVDKAHLNGSNCRSIYLKDASTNFSKASLSAPVSYFSIMPAPLSVARPMPKSTRNFATIFCMHNYSSGKPNFNPLGDGTALMPLETTSKNVFHFNFHVSPLHQNNIGDAAAGHTLFLGTTGVGKSVLQCALTAYTTRFGCQLFALDKDRSMDVFIRALGGDYFRLRIGERTGINPFQFPDTKKLRGFLNLLVGSLVKENGVVSASDEHKISTAIDAIFELDYSQRRLGYITQLIADDTDSPNSLVTRLSKWIGAGSLGWVIDNPVNQFDPEKFKYVGFDITSVLTPNNPVTEPLLACLFYLKDEMLARGVPTVTTVEEFWLPAMYPLTANSMVNTLKTGRKLYEYMLLITQQPEDAINSPIFETVVQQTVTKIFLPNPNALWDGYQKCKITEKEFEKIQKLDLTSRTFLVKQNQQSAYIKLDLRGFTDEINVFSAQPKTLNHLDEMIASEKYHDAIINKQPEMWLPAFLKAVRGTGGQVNLDINQFDSK